MNLRQFTSYFLIFLSLFSSCEEDDDTNFSFPLRDRNEVYEEDLAEIEAFLQTHTYNYEEFDFNNPYTTPSNDSFKIEFDTIIEGVNDDKDPLIERDELKIKIVEDLGIDYKLYYLDVREGLGDEINFCDEASVVYRGSLTTGDVFDSAVNPTKFNLISVGTTPGVVKGFQQGLIEFKTSTGFTENGDGTDSYHNHGIGAVFIPSGLGYFEVTLGNAVPSYTPIIFDFNLYERTVLDHDNDGIPSFMEDLNHNEDVYDDDTDSNSIANFIDDDDDGDGYLTAIELEYGEYLVLNGDPEPTFDPEVELETSREELTNGNIIIYTVILLDSNDDGIPDYLDKNTIPE